MERIVGFNHEVLTGIRDFSTPDRGWICHFIDPRPDLLPLVSQWEPHGIIVFLGDTEIARRVQELERPFVDVAAWVPNPTWPQVGFDDCAIGRMAADYFLKLGYEQYAFIGNPSLAYSGERQTGYMEVLRSNGYNASTFAADPNRFPPARGWTMGGVDGELISWLTSHPKPLAVFAENDERALLVSEACRVGGLRVPNEVAILGVDDDPYLCGLGFPSLSSIATPMRRLGYLAAERLNQLINGMPIGREKTLLPPSCVMERHSTNSVAYGNPDVAAAMRFIRDNAVMGAGVDDVVAAAGVSRRTLERLFEAEVGSSILGELTRVKMDRARAMLASSSDPIKAIALECGFQSQTWLATAHRKAYGITPLQYRNQVQGR
jgi:LacI family transcriptional regulator